MRFIEIPALITEDIEDPSIVEITEPITVSISGTTMTIDGGSKVSGEASVTLTGDVTVNAFTLQNVKQPSIHKISVKTNRKGNFKYVPNDTVTASSVSTTTKTGSDFEILLITTTGGETYVDFDMADYVSPALYTSNALTGFDISELTSTYGATAKLYKPDGTLLTTVTSATTGNGVNFGYTESTPQDVTYTLEVEDDLGRTSRYDLPRKWISYAMETNSTPGFEKIALAGNEYTSTTIVPNLTSTSKVRVHKTGNHGYLGINFKIQGRNTTNGAWVDIDDTGENENDDESKEFLAFGDYLYHRVWVKPTAKATTTVSSSNVVTLTLSNLTEENVTTSFTGVDPFDLNESTNTYVFEETTKVGTIPFTVTLGTETYTNAVTATTEGTAYDYVTLAFANPTLSLTTSNVTISSAKLYRDDVLFHTYGTESNVVLRSDQTGTYQAIVNDVYYSNRITPDFTTTRSVSAPQLEFDGYNRLNLSNSTPTSTTLGLPDGTTRDLTTQSNVYIYETGTYTANVQTSDTFAYLSNVVTSQPSQNSADVGPTFTFDGYNRLNLSNLTQTSSTLKYGSITYDTNTASNVYVTDTGEYILEAKDANTFVMSNVYVGAVSQHPSDVVPTLTFDGYNKLTIENVSFSANEWPPTDGTVTSGSLGQTSTWSISGASYGNGTYVATSSVGIHAWNTYAVFDKNLNVDSWHTSSGNTTGTLKIQLPESIVLGSYSLYHRNIGDVEMGPKDWTIEGSNNDSTWTTIDTQTAQDMSTFGSAANDYIRTYTVSGNTTKYSYYRIVVTANNGNVNYLSIGEWKMFTPLPDNTVTIKKDGAAFATTTSNTVYIRNAGTYTAEVKGSGAYVTEVSKVVSGDITEFPNYVNATSFYYGGGVVDNTGKLYTWGHDGYGDSGRGASDRVPTHLSSISDPVSNVWRGTPGYTMAAKTSTDKWYMWGRNTYSGVLGNTTNTGNVTVPEDVTAKVTTYFGDQTVSANKIIKMAMGEHHAVALTAGGKVWSWGGDATYYATGTGTNDNTVLVTPVQLNRSPPISGQTGYEITNTNSAVSTLKIRANGSIFTFNSQTCWYYDRLAGSNNTWYTQQLGYVPSTNTFIEASISGNPDQVYHNKTSSNVTKGSITVPPEGILLSNDPGSWNGAALFANPFTSTSDPLMTGITNVEAVYHGTAALDSSGNVWFWGGASTSMQYAYPTKLLDSSSIPGIVGLRATNKYSLFTWKSDGTFYTRGAGTYGQLATGSETDQYASWQTVTTLQGKTIKKVFGGNENMFVWTDDGVYGVGRGNNYKLGNGSTSNRSTFHKSNTLSALSIKEIDFGHATGLVLTTDGKGYMWGEDASNSMANALSGHQSGAAEATSISALSLVHIPSPSITYDGKNKLTVGGTNYADTATVSDPNGSIHEIGTAKTMYVKDIGDYVFKISGTDKYVESNVYVSSVDLAGAPTKPIDFDGYNKLTLIDAGSNVSANVTYFSNTYELGSANVLYINGVGTYDLEMSGSNVFALSSNVVGAISTGVIANPVFTSTTAITTDTNWTSGSGWEITADSTNNSTDRPGWKAFDNTWETSNEQNIWHSAETATSTSSPKWLKIKYPSAYKAIQYSIQIRDLSYPRYPKTWKFQGSNNDSDWTDLDTQTNKTDWAGNNTVMFTFSNSTAYQYYRVYITATDTSDSDGGCCIRELKVYTLATGSQVGNVPLPDYTYPNTITVDSALSGTSIIIANDSHQVSGGKWYTLNHSTYIGNRFIFWDNAIGYWSYFDTQGNRPDSSWDNPGGPPGRFFMETDGDLKLFHGSNGSTIMHIKPNSSSNPWPRISAPSLTFDGYNKLTLENFTTTESDTRTAKLTDPNGSTYALGQTQDAIYIKDQGDYFLEVTNSDQSAVVKKTVGTVTSPPTYQYIGFGGMTDLSGSYTTTNTYLLKLTKADGTPLLYTDIETFTILMDNGNGTNLDFTHIFEETKEPYAAAVGATTTTWHGDSQLEVTALADGTTLSDHATNTYIAFYFKLNEPTTIIDGAILTVHRNDKEQWKNAKAFGTNTDPSTFSSPHTPTDWTELVEVTTVDGPLGSYNGGSNPSEPWTSLGATQDFNASAPGLYIQPSLTFDGYNKLSINNLTPTSSRLTYGSNTYEIGTASNVYIEHGGTYKFATGDANTFALVNTVVSGSVGSRTTLSETSIVKQFIYDENGYTDAMFSEASETQCIRLSSDGLAMALGDGNYNSNDGRLYYYERSSISDTFTKTHTFDAVSSGLEFGASVDMNAAKTRIAISGSDADNSAANAGRVYIYDRASTSASWPSSPTATITPPASTIKRFGHTVNMSDDGLTMITSGDGISSTANESGVYVYEYAVTAPSASTISFTSGSFTNNSSYYEKGPTTATTVLYARRTPNGLAEGYGLLLEYQSDGTTKAYCNSPSTENLSPDQLSIDGGPFSDSVILISGKVLEGQYYSGSTAFKFTVDSTHLFSQGPEWSKTFQVTRGISRFGFKVAMNKTGTRFIAGGPGTAYYVYHKESGTWNSTAVLTGETGYHCGMSPDGDTVAVGMVQYSSNLGRVAVYKYSGSSWGSATNIDTTVGSGIYQIGNTPVFNNDGTLLVTGCSAYNSYMGCFEMWKYENGSWVFKNQFLNPTVKTGHGGGDTGEFFGGYLSMDYAGTSLIVSNTGNDVAGDDYGRVVLYGAGSPPSLTYDTSNKLSIENLTPTSTTLTDPNGSSFDIGTASNVYIRDSGKYSIASKDANTFVLASTTVTGTPTGTTYVYDSNTFTTPSQTYDNTKTITVSNVPSTLTDVAGKIYKGSTAYTIHATTSSSNVIIKNTGSYVSVFTTATQAFLTNAIGVTTQPTTTSDDTTIEDEGFIPGSTAVPDETTTDAPSVTLDATDTTVTDPTLDLDFTATLPRTLKRYNGVTNSSIGARFNRHETNKKRIEKSISIPSSFSAELTANNASSPTTLTVTVANSKFVINGDETPTLGFIRGETYTFDQSDASNSGHPLVLATSEDGTQYTTGWTASGTPGTDGSHAFIVPYDVPDTIYYKCTNHAGMGGEIHTTFGNAFSLGDFTVAANTHVSGEYTLATNYDGTTSNLYVNGSLITQTTPSPAISAGVKDFILGKEFDGYVKNFKFWNYAKHFILFTNPNFTGEGVLNSFSGVTLEYVNTTGVYANYIWKTSSGNIVTDSGVKFNVVERRWYDVRTGDETDANNKPYHFEIRQGNASSVDASGGTASNPSGVCINGNLVIFRGINDDNDWLNSIYMSGIV
jgi:alpha-tubulin suppressor-like RCC1 family protein